MEWVFACLLLVLVALPAVLAKYAGCAPRTAEDVLRELVEGLENGTIVFGEERDGASREG